MDKLLDAHILKNTNTGYVNTKGNHVGFYKTVHKLYIENRYADKAKKL